MDFPRKDVTRHFTFTFLVPSLCGLSMFKIPYSVSNTCHSTKSSNHYNFGLNWPSSSVKKLFNEKIAFNLLDSHKQARKQRGTGTLNTEGRTSMTE
jgi:hypothetical protein